SVAAAIAPALRAARRASLLEMDADGVRVSAVVIGRIEPPSRQERQD
ncbi:MAG: hypothetical protein H0X30_07850, partial [Anaerolineae bacterium]|nr:hypothetical protein [Anaerolineae bacterium]